MSKRTCSVPDCNRPVHARGWCCAHYQRWRATGEVSPDRPIAVRGGTCSVANCNRAHYGHGWCSTHLARLRTHGCPQPHIPVRKRRVFRITSENQAEVFWDRVDTSDPMVCWEWPGPFTTGGYGSAPVGGGKKAGAHRVAWTVTHGPIPPGMYVCHRCDNPPCVNPDHLFLGTPAENTHDRNKKGRGGRKLTPRKVREIRARMDEGASPAALARKYGVSSTVIQNVSKRKIWKHID